ncbi:hypothetical protein DFH08DRAFT_1078150 [Mycena albidolilacea]|uniref:Uncharacterized protein n=1 Tax=Mycena albidolilacea TaxID=1033008 RepID=A0AAD7A9B8_9AGAR|nr:hypothetical protein DFH08DRAFT_1078150 [Mycena albidolilacea]
MNSNRTTTLHPDFKAALRGLSLSVQNAMVSWHDVQTVSLGASSHAHLGSSFASFRNSLQLHWTEIMAYLQECYRFGEDAIIWERSLGDSVLESVSWLEELTSFSDEIKLKSEDLVRQSGQDIEALSHLTPQLSELLRAASSSKSSTVFPTPPAFLQTRAPDGPAAIASISAALVEIRTSLCMLQQFWTAASETCRSLDKSKENITLDRARKLGDTWREYQQEILETKVSIAKSLDAVATEPAAPRAFRRQRRGSSKSEISISSSPQWSSSPRRMSSLDDDQVPKACWGLGGFSLGKRR